MDLNKVNVYLHFKIFKEFGELFNTNNRGSHLKGEKQQG